MGGFGGTVAVSHGCAGRRAAASSVAPLAAVSSARRRNIWFGCRAWGCLRWRGGRGRIRRRSAGSCGSGGGGASRSPRSGVRLVVSAARFIGRSVSTGVSLQPSGGGAVLR
jgi:hypothetical protein